MLWCARISGRASSTNAVAVMLGFGGTVDERYGGADEKNRTSGFKNGIALPRRLSCRLTRSLAGPSELVSSPCDR